MRSQGARGGRWRRRGHRGLTAAVAELVGMPVGVAVPLQRHRPGLVLGACLAELAALASVILTAEPAAFAILALSAGVLVALATTNQRRVLAFTSTGVLVVVASAKGRPVAAGRARLRRGRVRRCSV